MQISIRLNDETTTRIKKLASENMRSFNNEVNKIIAEYFKIIDSKETKNER